MKITKQSVINNADANPYAKLKHAEEIIWVFAGSRKPGEPKGKWKSK